MTKPTKIVSSENRIKWVSMEDSWPPIGDRVLTFHGGGDGPIVNFNELQPGIARHGQDPSLFYWVNNP